MGIRNRIREHRLRAGYTMRELARVIGCPSSQMSNWENQRNQPSMQNLHRIWVALHKRLPDLRLEDLINTLPND